MFGIPKIWTNLSEMKLEKQGFEGEDILTENITHQKLFSMNVYQLQHIGRNVVL